MDAVDVFVAVLLSSGVRVPVDVREEVEEGRADFVLVGVFDAVRVDVPVEEGIAWVTARSLTYPGRTSIKIG